MPLTRAGIENEIVTSLRGVLVCRYYAMSVLTDGTNPDLNGPIRLALRTLGGNTADPLTVADSDLAGIAGYEIERLVEIAKIETYRSCLGKLAFVDIQFGQDRQRLNQFIHQIEVAIRLAEHRLRGQYPTGVARMSGPGLPNNPFDPYRSRSNPCNWPYP